MELPRTTNALVSNDINRRMGNDCSNEKLFKDDGSATIGDFYFHPVELKDKTNALDDVSPAVVHGVDDEKFARYDVFNTDGNSFCGHLDLFYDRGGYLWFAEQRKNEKNKYEIRVSDLTSGMLFGSFNFPESRSSLTKAMMEAAVELHNLNSESNGWKEIQKNDLPQRCKCNLVGE